MNELAGDKNYIDNLLKALPVEDAIKTFNEIDSRIVQLLECSSEDFLSLNDHFKNYHKESKNIAQNASTILQLITDSKINTLFTALKNFNESYGRLASIFTKHIENLDLELKKSGNKFDNLKLAYQNLTQNVASIKLLINGLTKSTSVNYSEIEHSTENIKKQVVETSASIEEFEAISADTFLMLTNIKKDNYLHLQKISDTIEMSFILFSKKHNEATNYYPSLKELTEKNSANIANIITNLQYHDIIRQKIEHIQRTHKDITSELKAYASEEQTQALLHNKAKTFLKIRDVAGLQAAQLLHANKQYQVAIEEIGNNLEQIGNEMLTVSSMCENLVGISVQTKEYYLNNIVANLNTALDYNKILTKFINTIKEKTELLAEKNTLLYSQSKTINNEKNLLIGKISKLISEIPANKLNELEKEIAEVQSLLYETEHHQSHISEIHKELNLKVEQLVNPQENFITETEIVKNLSELSLTIPNLVELLKESIQKIDELLYFNTSICINISDNIKNSIANIKYYDLFEKACDKIIADLNFINLKLNYGEGLTDENREANLRQLKERYTMASEHIIHEQLAQMSDLSSISGSNAEQIIDLANQGKDEDDDNLELF